MLNATALRRAGLGDLPPSYSGTYNPTGINLPPNYGQIPGVTTTTSGHSTRDAILGTIGAGLNVLGVYLLSRNPNLQYGVNPQGQYVAPNAGAYYANDPNYQAYLARTQGGGVGFGVDGQGIRLSDGSHISWVMIAVVVGGFMLIQSRPFSRR